MAIADTAEKHCLGIHDHWGWYRDRTVTDVDLVETFDGKGTVYSYAGDWTELASNAERSIYATTSYYNPDDFKWRLFARNDNNGHDWKDDESPMPGYRDIQGFSILADIDLADEHKERPLPREKQELVERKIAEYVTAFEELTGGKGHVFALDSVGGVYVLTPPAATAPIARTFDEDERKRIFEALRKRADSWLNDARERVNQAINDDEDIFDADLLNQKNRQYKAPLSLHSSIDGVVHPLDIEDGEPAYEFVPIEDVSSGLVDETTAWANEFTDEGHADAVERIVAGLWPEYADENDGWQDALEAWVADEREAEAKQRERDRKAAEKRAQRAEDRDDGLPPFTAAIGDGADIGITPDFDDVQAAVDGIDARDVVRKLCDEFDTDGRTPPRFNPGYRDSNSGTSCFVDSEKIHDNADSHDGIGVLGYVAREKGYIGEKDTADHNNRAKARDDLRELGFEIPLWTPAKGSKTHGGDEFEEMPFWSVRKATVALGEFPADGFVEKESDDGGTYPGFPGPKSHNDALDAIEDAGLEHDRERPKIPAEPENPDSLTPLAVMAEAGLGEDDSVADLGDRAKAACVWELLVRNDDVHVRVRRDNDSLWAYEDGIWEPKGERALRHAARQALGSMNYGQKVLRELKAQARSDIRGEVESDEFGVSTGTVAVENGLIDLDAAANGDDDARRELRPDDYALAQLPVEYDPEAEYDEWAAYVEEWAEDGKADALQEYVGYCLHIGALPIHRALLLVGQGANGKGTFLHVVRALLGDENDGNTSSIELQTLANEKDAVADFYGSLANIDDDLSARKLGKGKGMFKKLIAGDRVRARALYESGFEFEATGKHLYAANKVPKVDVPDDDEAFWRRWLLIEFPNFYPPNERDGDLRYDLAENDATMSGVLNWAIDGWQRAIEQGYFTGEEQLAHDKRRRWQSWGDSVDEFISECVEHDDDAPRMTTAEAHARYAAWCDEQDDTDAMKQQPFTVRLKAESVGYGKHRIDGKVQRGYTSLGLSDDVPEADDSDGPDDSTQERL